jgi:hypothetical protein
MRICTVFSSGAPKKDAGPVTENNAPILTGSEGGGGEQLEVSHKVPSTPIPAITTKILFMSVHLSL